MRRAGLYFIRDSGGALYLWSRPLGGDFSLARASTKKPPEIDFEHWPRSRYRIGVEGKQDVYPYELYVERGLELPHQLPLEFLRFPRPHLTPITGEAAGADGGGS